jgi:hypothetical protein
MQNVCLSEMILPWSSSQSKTEQEEDNLVQIGGNLFGLIWYFADLLRSGSGDVI